MYNEKEEEALLTPVILERFKKAQAFGDGRKVTIQELKDSFDFWKMDDHTESKVLAHYYVPYQSLHFFVVGAKFDVKLGWILVAIQILEGEARWCITTLRFILALGNLPVGWTAEALRVCLETPMEKNLEHFLRLYQDCYRFPEIL